MVMYRFNSIATPALLLNLSQLEKNIAHMTQFARDANIAIRPHIKTHKSIEIAKRQLVAGAVGVTVAKVGEAEIMVAGGITDILIAYPLVSQDKLHRVNKLLNRADITITIDSVEQATIVNNFFTPHEKINVWIKVNAGLNRVGVEPNEQVVTLAKHIMSLPYLNLTGIFTHAGQSYAAKSIDEIKQIATKEAQTVVNSAKLCKKAGIHIEHRSVGSTPTFKYSGLADGITEIRPGNAVFYDMVQVGLGVAEIDDCALKVLTTVVSKQEDRFVIDAGSKTLALDKGAHGNESIQGYGFIEQYPDLTIARLSEEHGVVPINSSPQVSLNERLMIIPNHACPVVNLFENYVVHRNGEFVDQWQIDARGKIQ